MKVYKQLVVSLVLYWAAMSSSVMAQNARGEFAYAVYRDESGGAAMVELNTRDRLEPQFCNKATGQSGKRLDYFTFVPGPSPLADKVCQLQSVRVVYIRNHSVDVQLYEPYRPRFQAEIRKVAEQLGYPNAVIRPLTDREFEFTNPFKGEFDCDWKTLYLPTLYWESMQELEAMNGVESVDLLKEGFVRVHKGRLFKWPELEAGIRKIIRKPKSS